MNINKHSLHANRDVISDSLSNELETHGQNIHCCKTDSFLSPIRNLAKFCTVCEALFRFRSVHDIIRSFSV
jgi:hypothetical protein